MNLRYTLILLLVAVALATFAYTQRDTEPVDVGAGTATPTAAPLYDLKPEDVQEVAVVGATGSYTLTRVAGGWEVDGQTASEAVDTVVKNLAQPTIVRDLPADLNPDEYGFTTSTLTVTLKTAKGESKVLEVGDDTPVDFNTYVREKDSQRIIILGRSDFTSLRDWLTTRPFAPTPTPTTDAAAIEGTPGAEGIGTPGAEGLTLPPLLGTPGVEPTAEGGTPTAEATPEGEGGDEPPLPTPTATATETTS